MNKTKMRRLIKYTSEYICFILLAVSQLLRRCFYIESCLYHHGIEIVSHFGHSVVDGVGSNRVLDDPLNHIDKI